MFNNQSKSRFEIEVENQTVFADYRLTDNKLHITHVETPPELRGKGAAAKLMQQIINYATEHKLDVIPICIYAASWMRRQQKS